MADTDHELLIEGLAFALQYIARTEAKLNELLVANGSESNDPSPNDEFVHNALHALKMRLGDTSLHGESHPLRGIAMELSNRLNHGS